MKGRIFGYIKFVDSSQLENIIFFDFNTVFCKKTLDIDKFYILNIFILKMAVKLHILGIESVLIDMETV